MRKAFEMIKPDGKVKEQVLREILKYNREKSITEEVKTMSKEIIPRVKEKRWITAMKILTAVFAILIIGTGVIYIAVKSGKSEDDRVNKNVLSEDMKKPEDYKNMGSLQLCANNISSAGGSEIVEISAVEERRVLDGAEQETGLEDIKADYMIFVNINNIYYDNGEQITYDKLEKLINSYNVPITVYYDTVMETYPAKINAEAVIVEYNKGEEKYIDYENKDLNIYLKYNPYKLRCTDSVAQNGLLTFRINSENITEAEKNSYISIYKSEYNYDDTVEGLIHQAPYDAVYAEDINYEPYMVGKMITVWENDRTAGQKLKYYVINKKGSYGDGKIYVIEINDYVRETGEETMRDVWTLISESFRFTR